MALRHAMANFSLADLLFLQTRSTPFLITALVRPDRPAAAASASPWMDPASSSPTASPTPTPTSPSAGCVVGDPERTSDLADERAPGDGDILPAWHSCGWSTDNNPLEASLRAARQALALCYGAERVVNILPDPRHAVPRLSEP